MLSTPPENNKDKPVKQLKSSWISYDSFDRDSIKEQPGCYVVYIDGKLSYVGQASNVKKRIYQYRIRQGYGNGVFHSVGGSESFAEILTIKVRYSTRIGDWAMREIRLIKRLQPPLNYVHGGLKKRTIKIKNTKGVQTIYLQQPTDLEIAQEMQQEMADEDNRDTEKQRMLRLK